MNVISRALLIVVCFFAAIACYVFGIPAGGVAFVVLGVIFEGLFWMGIFGKRKKSSSSTSK